MCSRRNLERADYWTRGSHPSAGELPFVAVPGPRYDSMPLLPGPEGPPFEETTVEQIQNTTDWFVRALAAYLDKEPYA